MSKLNIRSNRKAKKYTRKELFWRLLWGGGKVLFRLTPRPFFSFRRVILRAFGAKVGSNVHIYPTALVYFPWNLSIGSDSSIGEWAMIYNLGKVIIGEQTTISQRVHLCAGTHDYKDEAMPLLKPPIYIGSNVWVCADAFVGPNVKVGDGAIVAAVSVVVKNVPSSSIVGGNPAKFIKNK